MSATWRLMDPETRRGPAAPSGHTYAGSTRQVNKSRARDSSMVAADGDECGGIGHVVVIGPPAGRAAGYRLMRVGTITCSGAASKD